MKLDNKNIWTIFITLSFLVALFFILQNQTQQMFLHKSDYWIKVPIIENGTWTFTQDTTSHIAYSTLGFGKTEDNAGLYENIVSSSSNTISVLTKSVNKLESQNGADEIRGIKTMVVSKSFEVDTDVINYLSFDYSAETRAGVFSGDKALFQIVLGNENYETSFVADTIQFIGANAGESKIFAGSVKLEKTDGKFYLTKNGNKEPLNIPSGKYKFIIISGVEEGYTDGKLSKVDVTNIMISTTANPTLTIIETNESSASSGSTSSGLTSSGNVISRVIQKKSNLLPIIFIVILAGLVITLLVIYIKRRK